MPAYNVGRFIGEAVESVLAQTFCGWELIIVDDCSADGTADIAGGYAARDPRIRLISNERNRGVSFSRMEGIRAAQYPWVAFLDSDDRWREDKLEKQIALLQEEPDAKLLFTASAFIAEDGTPYSYVLQVPERVTYGELLRGNVMSCSSVMVQREWMLRYPMENDSLHEDYASWLRILKEVPYACGVNEPLLTYRLSQNSKSSGRLTSAKMVYRTYKDLGYGTLRSGIMTLRYASYSIAKRRSIVDQKGTAQHE